MYGLGLDSTSPALHKQPFLVCFFFPLAVYSYYYYPPPPLVHFPGFQSWAVNLDEAAVLHARPCLWRCITSWVYSTCLKPRDALHSSYPQRPGYPPLLPESSPEHTSLQRCSMLTASSWQPHFSASCPKGQAAALSAASEISSLPPRTNRTVQINLPGSRWLSKLRMGFFSLLLCFLPTSTSFISECVEMSPGTVFWEASALSCTSSCCVTILPPATFWGKKKKKKDPALPLVLLFQSHAFIYLFYLGFIYVAPFSHLRWFHQVCTITQRNFKKKKKNRLLIKLETGPWLSFHTFHLLFILFGLISDRTTWRVEGKKSTMQTLFKNDIGVWVRIRGMG